MTVKNVSKNKCKNKLTNDDIERIFGETNIDDLIDAEIRKVLAEMEYGPHADQPEYKVQVDGLKALIEAKAAYQKANTDKEKVEAKAMCDKAASKLDMNVIVPILIKAGLSLMVILFWISVEQGRPVSNRLINWTSNLLIPR